MLGNDDVVKNFKGPSPMLPFPFAICPNSLINNFLHTSLAWFGEPEWLGCKGVGAVPRHLLGLQGEGTSFLLNDLHPVPPVAAH